MSIINLREVKRAHAAFLRRNERALQEAAEFAETHTRQHIERNHKFKSRSGKILRGVRTRIIRLANGRLVRQTNRAKHAPFIEFGTKPHRITARRRKTLAFSKGGQLIFRRSVNHPGNRPYKFGFKAQSAAFRLMGRFLQAEMERVARQF